MGPKRIVFSVLAFHRFQNGARPGVCSGRLYAHFAEGCSPLPFSNAQPDFRVVPCGRSLNLNAKTPRLSLLNGGRLGSFLVFGPTWALSFLADVVPCGRVEGCRASFQQSLIHYLLGGDGCLPVLVARGTSMKPVDQGGGAGGGLSSGGDMSALGRRTVSCGGDDGYSKGRGTGAAHRGEFGHR